MSSTLNVDSPITISMFVALDSCSFFVPLYKLPFFINSMDQSIVSLPYSKPHIVIAECVISRMTKAYVLTATDFSKQQAGVAQNMAIFVHPKSEIDEKLTSRLRTFQIGFKSG